MRYLIAILCAAMTVAVTMCSTARAAEPQMVYDEIVSTDGVNDFVLTIKDCPLDENHGYTKYMYVKQKAGIVAEGCWMDYNPTMFDIWIPVMKAHFQMYKGEFKAHGTPRAIVPPADM